MPRVRQLAAIMFTDIEGYTAIMQQNEEKAIQSRNKHRHVFNSITEKHQGRVLQYYGDGTLSVFDSAIDAVICGIEMQLGFQKQPAIPVRIGIHMGDIIFSKEEIIGDSVNIASRIESLAVPGSVFISGKIQDEIKNQNTIQTSLLGTFQLRNVERPIEVYAISNEGLIVPRLQDIKGKTVPEKASKSEKSESHGSKISGQDPGPRILATKLYAPPPRLGVVHRSRLIEQLNKGLHGKLTIISAPAGFGKTTLVSDWISLGGQKVAWLSLDEGDNDPVRFLSYFLAALQKITSGIGESALAMLKSPQPPPTESILTALINDVAKLPDNFTMVLDDYHEVDSKDIDEAIIYILDHLPPQMHLIITTRTDPALSQPRLRVRGQLTELRIKDLRFTPSEAAEFLSQVMGLTLSAEDIAALETRTEGWVAGLQLAALSMQGREDVSGFIRAFAGHNRYIVDYLAEEVLQRQSGHMRSFLIQTSILNRLNGPLCNAVTGLNDGKEMLEALDRGNLFVIPLDDKRYWYRYHHLFADVLKANLMEAEPGQVPILHRRAAEWHEEHGTSSDAIYHMLAAGDFEKAARLIELNWPPMERNYQHETWLSWVKVLPEEVIRVRPVLSAAYAWALLDRGNLETAKIWLEQSETWLNEKESTTEESDTIKVQMIVDDDEQFRSLPGTIATAHAYMAQATGNVKGTVRYARKALELLSEEDIIRRGTPQILLGFASWTEGDLNTAYHSIVEAMDSFKTAGDYLFAISGAFLLADIRLIQGLLREAAIIYKESFQLADKLGDSILQGTAYLHMGFGMLNCEHGNFEEGRQHLLKGREIFERFSFPMYRLLLAESRFKAMEGDLDESIELLNEAERLSFRNPMPEVQPVGAMRARVWIKQGRLAEAMKWVDEEGLSVNDDIIYLHEFEHITLARLHIARYRMERIETLIQGALGLLEHLLEAAEEGGRKGAVLEILILETLAYQAQENFSAAHTSLIRSLTLAEPEDYAMIFVNEGAPMEQLLSELKTQGALSEYVKKLLTIFGRANEKNKEI